MVLRIKKRRKYFGGRRWGAGNIKNARGAGDRGGVGRGGRKHKMTYLLVYERESLVHKGFAPWKRKSLNTIDLSAISKRVSGMQDSKPTIELKGFKVLGDGRLAKPAVVKASGFSKSAEEKIKQAGGEAVRL
ncbi:MAG: mitochondrial large ribosomal subunit protein uL15m [Candidatus Micrarchaeota archaeon]|nr:mitochondrial large ribosomal subunit protein uL15m [Candidatus Micrarchaeota archaeon]